MNATGSSRLESGLYVGRVTHRRRDPDHAFGYDLFMLYVDLDEIPELFGSGFNDVLWSADRPAPAWLRRHDYLGDARVPLATAVRDAVEAETGSRPGGPIRMLTHGRYFGIVFNPLTLYYCFDPGGEIVETVVAEVTNTPWGERHTYVLDIEHGTDGRLRASHPKQMHVSPFLGMDLDYNWKLGVPGDTLRVSITTTDGEGTRVFDAALDLRRRPWTRRNRNALLLRYPLMTAKVLAGIYFEALRLWRKRARVYPHPRSAPATTPAAHDGTREREAAA